MPGLQDSTSSAPSDRGDTSAAPNGRAEDGVPEAGGDAEIAAVAIVMRHVPHPRPIENVAGLNREVMRRVMHRARSWFSRSTTILRRLSNSLTILATAPCERTFHRRIASNAS